MAQRIQVLLEDDVDGSQAEETVRFSIDSANYEIDLSAANAEKFRESIAPWVGHARKMGAPRKTGQAPSRQAGPSTNEIRTWAQQNGMKVAPRGRISAEVRRAYDERNG